MKKYRLGYTQTKLALTHEYGGDDKLITVTAVQGSIHFSHLTQCLKLLFDKYALLRCSLQKDKNYFLQDDVAFEAIPIDYRQGTNPTFWREFVAAKLKQLLPIKQYLWRFTLLSLPDNKHYLIVEYHHVMTDGISSAHLMHELLTLYTNSPPVITPQDIIPPAECLFKTKSELIDNIDLPPMPAFEKCVSLEQREARNLLLAFTLEPFQVFSKKFNLKINAIFTALLLLSVGYEDVVVSTCVNQRGRIPDTNLTANDFGVLFTNITNRFNLSKQDNFVEMTKFIEEEINKNIAKFIQPTIPDFEGINQQVCNKNFQCHLDMSNLGKIELQKSYGNLNTLAYFFFVNQALGFSELLFNVATREDEVFVNFTYVYPLHSDEWALGIVKKFIENMHNHIPNFTLIPEWTDRDLSDDRWRDYLTYASTKN